MYKNILNSIDDYSDKKKVSQQFHKFMVGEVSFSKAIELQSCANLLQFVSDKEFEKHKLWRMITCKDSFCPMCMWRKSRRDMMKIGTVMKWLKQEHSKEFIMLTLTYKRVSADELSSTIDKFQNAFNRMFNRKKIKDLSHGYVKKLEVTYDKNKKVTSEMYKQRKEFYDRKGILIGMDNPNFDTYNVHYHVLIAVNKSYFTDTKVYMNRDEWLKFWRRAMKDDLITQVDVRKVRPSSEKEGSEVGGAWEIAKYTAKSADYLVNEDVFFVFRSALYRRRRIVYSGLFREGAEKYDEGELDYLLEKDETDYEYLLKFAWHFSNEVYNKSEVRLLTDEEKEELKELK